MNKSNSHQDYIDIKDILGSLLNNKWLIIFITLLFTIGGVIYTKLRMPLYSADVLISVNSSSEGSNLGSLVGGGPSMGFNRFSPRDIEKQIQLIKSRSVLEPVVKELKLDVSIQPYYFPVIGEKIAYNYEQGNFVDKPSKPFLGLTSYSWGGEYVVLNDLDMSGGFKGQTFILVYLGDSRYQVLSNNGKILINGIYGLDEIYQKNKKEYFKINIDKIVAFPGTKFRVRQKHLSDAIIALAGHLTIKETDDFSQLLQLSYTGSSPARITQILDAIAHSAVDSEIKRKASNANEVLQFLRARLPEVQKKLEMAETKLNDYRSESGNISVTASTQIVLQQLSGYDAKIAELELQKAQLGEKLTENNPELIQAENTIKELKKQKHQIELEIKKLPKSDQITINLMREVEVESEVYQNMMQKIQHYEILKVGTMGSLQLIDSANIPYKPTNKPAKSIIALAFILGLFLSIAWVFVRNYLFKGLEDPDRIEEMFSLEILGSLHKSKTHEKQAKKLVKGQIKKLQFLDELDPHDITIESLRSLRTNILFKLAEAKNNVISITGPVPEVGKTFLSTHLAHILVESSNKVLLIDADIRKGDAYKYFFKDQGIGLIDYLQNKVKVDEIVQSTGIENFDFISTGKLQNYKVGMPSRVNMAEFITHFSSKYDVVIIDNAPLLAVNDAITYMKYSGLNILTLASAKHDEKEIKLTIKRATSAGVTFDGFVFNLVQLSHSYYGNKYAYKYTYK